MTFRRRLDYPYAVMTQRTIPQLFEDSVRRFPDNIYMVNQQNLAIVGRFE